jgi:uncharacterized membrane protein
MAVALSSMSRKRKISLLLMVLLYIGAGANHFLSEPVYQSIMPPYIPYHKAMVYISGICEMLFGLLLIPAATRPIAAWLIILLLVAVFPANIQMTIDHWNKQDLLLWISIGRLPLQFVLIRWAWFFTKTHSANKNRQSNFSGQ